MLRRALFACFLITSTSLTGAPLGAAPDRTQTLDLTVVVKDLRSDQGRIEVALWRDPKGFTDAKAAVAKLTVVPQAGTAHVVFPGLPPGEYALASYHDENGNGKFDKTFIGWPDEGLGFSNGAWIKLGPPSFKDAKITLQPDAKTAVISLRY